ncbi:helix-turn-helix domain-containing protein [Pseudomonas lini]
MCNVSWQFFESFSSDRSSLTLQDIADRIELPKSTTFRIVQSLEKAGYLVRLEQQYCLSFRFTRLAGLVKKVPWVFVRSLDPYCKNSLSRLKKQSPSMR